MKKIKHILLSMLVPLVIVGLVLVIAYIFCGVGITANDCFEQYIPFFGVYYDILTEGDSIFYSLTGAMGYDLWSVFCYYLACPLNVIVLLFGKANLIYAVEVLIVLKIAFSGGTFAIYLKNRFPQARTNRIVLFSTFYAISGFVVGYAWNVMWMDGIVLFPLVMMGMDMLLRDEKPQWFLYTIFLALMIICCYFMGYMSCIFIFIYFFTYSFKSFGDFIKKLFRIGLSSVLAIGISGIVLIPTFFQLQETAISGETIPGPELYGSFVNCFKTIMIGVPQSGINFDRECANLFITVLGVLLAFVYFTSGKIKISDKIRKGLLLVILFISFNLKPLNYIWHGMHEQSGIPNRFSYMVIFLMLTMGFEVCMKKRREVTKRSLFIAWGLLSTGVTILAVFDNGLIINAVLTSVLALSYVFMLGFGSGRLKFNFIRVFALLEVFVTFLMGIFMSSGAILGDYDYYLEDFEKIEADKEEGFYREKIDLVYNEKEKYFENTMSKMGIEEFSISSIMDYSNYMKNIGHQSVINEGTYYGINAMGLFNTFHNYNLTDFYCNIGGTGGSNNAVYYGENAFMDMLLGVKYHYSRYYDVNSLAYELEKEVGEVRVYKNQYVLSAGYVVSDEFLETDISKTYNPFAAANDISSSITARNVAYINCFSRKSDNDNSITFESTVVHDGEFLLELSGSFKGSLVVMVDDEKVYDKSGDKLMISLGELKAGSVVNAILTFDNAEDKKDNAISVYSGTWNQAVFEKVYEALSDEMLNVYEYGDDYLKGSIELSEASKVLLTVPSANGWTIYVDGKETEPDTYRDLFYVFDLEKGNHEIMMEYRTPGWNTGFVVSVASCAIYIIAVIITLAVRYSRKVKQSDDN